MNYMFYNCTKLQYLDISSFRYNTYCNNNYCNFYNLFYKIHINVTITIHKSFYDKIKNVNGFNNNTIKVN